MPRPLSRTSRFEAVLRFCSRVGVPVDGVGLGVGVGVGVGVGLGVGVVTGVGVGLGVGGKCLR